MEDDFADEVQLIVGPSLINLGFEQDGVDDRVDEGGRYGCVVFYRRTDCKLQVYWSAREFEINAMIASSGAPNEHGLYNRSAMWHYLDEFIDRPHIPLEELVVVLKQQRENFQSTQRWLAWLRDKIVEDFEAARAGVLSSEA